MTLLAIIEAISKTGLLVYLNTELPLYEFSPYVSYDGVFLHLARLCIFIILAMHSLAAGSRHILLDMFRAEVVCV